MSKKRLRKPSRQYPELDVEDVSPERQKVKIEPKLGLAFKINQKFAPSENQKLFLDAAFHPSTLVVFNEGPAGTCKSYYAAYSALKMLKDGKIDEIIYIRSIVESAKKSMGSLPGEVGEKFRPWMKPLLEKCDELVGSHVADDLLKAGLIRCEPVNYLRGSTFKNCAVIVDEAQNLEFEELVTILTRVGENCKMLILGDSFQSDIRRAHFTTIKDGFSDSEADEKGFRQINYTLDDCRRNELLKFIIGRLDRLKRP